MNNRGNEVQNAKAIAASDAEWFKAVLSTDLFDRAEGSAWEGDPQVCPQELVRRSPVADCNPASP